MRKSEDADADADANAEASAKSAVVAAADPAYSAAAAAAAADEASWFVHDDNDVFAATEQQVVGSMQSAYILVYCLREPAPGGAGGASGAKKHA